MQVSQSTQSTYKYPDSYILSPFIQLFYWVSYIKNFCSFAIVLIRISFTLRGKTSPFLFIVIISKTAQGQRVVGQVQVPSREVTLVYITSMRNVAIEEDHIACMPVNRNPGHIRFDVSPNRPVSVLRVNFLLLVHSPDHVKPARLPGVGVDGKQHCEQLADSEADKGRLVLVSVKPAPMGKFEIDFFFVNHSLLPKQIRADIVYQTCRNLPEIFEVRKEVLYSAQKSRVCFAVVFEVLHPLAWSLRPGLNF